MRSGRGRARILWADPFAKSILDHATLCRRSAASYSARVQGRVLTSCSRKSEMGNVLPCSPLAQEKKAPPIAYRDLGHVIYGKVQHLDKTP